jgi:hypothetical protein
VRRHALDLIVLFVLASVVCGYVALAAPGVRSEALHAYVLALGALAMVALVSATSESLPRSERGEFERALGEGSGPERRLPELERTEREVTLGISSAYDLHHRLLPHLRECAQARLERRGLALAPEHVGRWWPLLRPDRPPPEEHFAHGIRVEELRALVDDLERI